MRKDTRFRRPERTEIEAKLPPGTLAGAAELGVWNMLLQSDDPSEVSHWYRSYRDSDHCSVHKEKLRSMRDAMIASMRESNKEDPKPRKEKKKGVHYNGHNNGWLPQRTSA
jgi:hypothetical protein